MYFEIARCPLFPYIRGGDRRIVDTQIVLRGFPCVIELDIGEVATARPVTAENARGRQELASNFSLVREAYSAKRRTF